MKTKQMTIGILLSYMSIFVRLLSGVLYTPIILKTLGQSQYGVYSLCTSFIGYLTIFNAGVNAAYVRFYVQEEVKNKENISKINGMFGRIFCVLSIIGLTGGIIITVFSTNIFGNKLTTSEYELVKRCFALLTVSVSVEIFTCLFNSFLIANEEFIYLKLIDIIGAILSPVITVPFLITGSDCTSVVWVRLVVSTLVLLTNGFYCRKKLNIGFIFSKVPKAIKRDVFQFVLFIVLQGVMDQLNWQIDKFILAWTQGSSEISIYTVGSTFNSYYIMIGATVSGIFIAEINRFAALKDNKRINALFYKTSKLFTYIISYIMLAFVFFGKAFIYRWAGAEYDDSYIIGCLLMFPVSFSLIMGLGQDIARAKNKHQLQIVLNLSVCIINMIVSIPLAKLFGAIGSALGTFAAEIILCIVIQPIYYKKILNIRIKPIVKNIIRFSPGLVIPLGFGIIINKFNLLDFNYISITIYGITFTVIYAISVFLLSMKREDRETVEVFIKKWRKKGYE